MTGWGHLAGRSDRFGVPRSVVPCATAQALQHGSGQEGLNCEGRDFPNPGLAGLSV